MIYEDIYDAKNAVDHLRFSFFSIMLLLLLLLFLSFFSFRFSQAKMDYFEHFYVIFCVLTHFSPSPPK